MAQDPTRVSPGDYSATAYDVLSKYDPAFPDNVSVEAFFDNLQSPEYAAKAYALLADADPELVNNLSIDDFIGNVKKKEEPVVTESVSDAGSSEQRIAARQPEQESYAARVRGLTGQRLDPTPYETPAEQAKRDSAVTAINTREAEIDAQQRKIRQEEAQRITADLPPVTIPEGTVTSAVSQLQELYGPYGIKFEEDRVPFAMTRAGSKVVKAMAPIGADGKPVEIRLELNEDGSIKQTEAAKLDKLIRDNATYVGETDRTFVEQSLQVQEMRPVPRIDSSGVSTVKMASAEVDGKFIAYPTLFPKDPAGTNSTNPNDWMELDFGMEAQNEAFKRGEVFYFDTEEEARAFGAGAWKDVVPMDLEFQKRSQELGRDYDADMAFLDELDTRRSEYKFLEELSPGSRYEKEIPASYQKYFIDGNLVRDDIETMRDEKEAELSSLESAFDADNVLLRFKEDRDVALGKRYQELSEESAAINSDAKAEQNRLQVESLNLYGVRLEDLVNYEPKTEAELAGMIDLYTRYNRAASQRQAAALGYEKAQTYYDKQHDKGITQEYVDGWEEVSVAWNNGLKRGRAMSKLLLMQYGYYDAIGDEGAEEQAMREVAEIMDSQDPRRGRVVSRANMTGTTDSYLAALASNPGMYTAAITAESLAQLAPIWARVLPAAAVAGGAIGGSVGLLPGSAVGFLSGAMTGAGIAVFNIGMPISELALEMGNATLEVGERMGYDWSDPNSALKALNDEELWSKAAERGYKRGVPIALTGALSNFVIGKVAGRAASIASTGERIARGAATGLVVEPLTEALGERIAIGATGEYTGSTANFREIMAEAIGAVGMGVSMGAAFGSLGYAKQKVSESSFDLAIRLMDPMGLAGENVSNERIMNWTNKMEKLGKLTPEQANAIRKNTGLRRDANELLGRKPGARPGVQGAVLGRLMQLLEAKEVLESRGRNAKLVFGKRINQINDEIAYIAENQSLPSEQVNLEGIALRTTYDTPGAYKFNGKNVSRQDFLSKLQEATPRQLRKARVYNDQDVALELAKRRQDNAVQERGTTEVPVGKRAGFGTEVDDEVREITQEVINDQAEGKLDEDQIETLLAPLAAKKARGEKLTDLEQQFAETNSSLLKRVEKDLKDLDKLVGDPNAQEQEGVTIIGKLTDRGKVVGKQARKAAKALRAAFPEVKIVLHSDDASFVEAAKKAGLKGTGRAFYGFDSKEIHVHTGRAKATTVAHEAFHAALRNSIDASDVQALMGDFVTALKKVIPADSDLAAKLDDFAQGYSEGRVDEEYVAEFFGELATAYPTLDRKGKSVIARFLERLSKLINLDLTLPSDLTQRDEQILSLLETLAGKVARGKAIKGKQVSQFQELVSSSDTPGAAEQRAVEDNLRAAEQRADDFSDEQIQAMAEQGVAFHFSNVDITKVLPEKLRRTIYGYGFYTTSAGQSNSVFRTYGDRVTLIDVNQLNLLDGDTRITEEQAKKLRDFAKMELEELDETGELVYFPEKAIVLQSLAELKAGAAWANVLIEGSAEAVFGDVQMVPRELASRSTRPDVITYDIPQQAQVAALIQEAFGFDGADFGRGVNMDDTGYGIISAIWNFGKLNRAIIEPGQEPRAAEQRVEQPFTTAAEQRTELSQSEINERNARVPESRNMPYKDVPSRMYHVTFAGEAIRKAGKLLASSGLGTGGIGGTESVGVSFYDNASDAEVLRNELDLISQANAIETEEEAQAFIDRLQESKGRSFQENYNLRRKVDDKVSDSLREVLRLERMRVNGPVILREETLPANQSPEIIEASKEDIPESTRILRGVDKNEVRVLSNVTVRERGASREAPRAAEQRVETNEDGSPKTFYHGTDATFEEFTPTEGVRTILASQIPVTSPAFFFTEDEAVAREYGKNVIPVNLSFSKLVHENIPEAVQIIKEVFPDGIEYSNGVIDYDDYTFEKNWIGKVLDSEEGIDWMLLDVPGFVDALKAAGFDGTLVYEGDEETSMAAFDNSNIQRLDREPRAAEQRVDVDEVRMRSRAGSRISKGLATYSVKGEKQVEEIENLTREYVKEQAPKAYIKNANILAKYPLVRGVREFGDITTVEQADEVYDIYTQQTLDNLRWMMETYPDEFSEISTLWYDGANKIANEMATRFGVTPEQAAGILASLSPQKDWYQNVRLAELLLEAFEDNPVMTREMIVYQKKKTAEVIKEKKKELKKARAKKGTSRARAKVEKFNKDKARLLNDIEVAEALLDAITALEGTRMMDADPSMMGYFVRLHSEETKPPQYQVISPDGEMVGPAKKDDGSTAKWAWGSYNEIGKGVSVMLNGSQENITASLGQQHKVRNFYNNIIDPMSTEGDVTMDTHAIAVSLLKPLSTKSDEVNHNFGGKGASSSGAKGIKGTYYANQEAYQILAEEMGLLPRQVQSVTWEAVRGLFTDKFKGNKENVKAINQIWENYADGKITIDEARAQVLERAGGVNPPVWAESVQRESGDGVREGRERGAGREGGRAAEQRVTPQRFGAADEKYLSTNADQDIKPKDGHVILYHRTSAESADAIAQEGFRPSLERVKDKGDPSDLTWFTDTRRGFGDSNSLVAVQVPESIVKNNGSGVFTVYGNISPEYVEKVYHGLEVDATDIGGTNFRAREDILRDFLSGKAKIELKELLESGKITRFTEPRAAEQRVVEPGVADVLQRYEFKPNNSLKNAELADELRRNLKRFGYGVKQYGTRMNDFRVVSLDTGRAVDPNKLIAAGLEERAERIEEQRMFEEMQQARELEERIIEIYDADERPFTGRDFESNAAEQRSKIEAMSQPDDTMRDIVAKGREMGFRDSAIRAVLMKRYGRDSTEAINTALAENADIFTVIPKPFGNVVGGLDVGRQIYAEVRAKLNEFMRPKSPGRMTKQQRADRIAELRNAIAGGKAVTVSSSDGSVQMGLFDTGNAEVMTEPQQSKLSDSQLLRKFPRPKTIPTRAEMMAEALEILKANRRFKEQPEKVQKELLVGFATSLKSRANKGVQNLLSQIRRDLKERKKGAKTAREVQAQLRTLINEVLPKTDYSKADVAKLTKLINEVNEDNYIVKAQKVLDLVDRKREQIRKATIREIAAFVKRSAKTYKTPGGRTRTRGLDAPGQAFFLEAKRILTAVFKKDQTDIMNIGFNLANNPEVDIATAKLMNGESLTVKEQMLIDQKDAYDLFAPLANMSLEQVEAVLEDLKVTAGFSRLNLKNIRMERAARLNALRQGAKDSVEGNWGGVVTKEVEEDGETRIVAKDSNELATDRANKKSLKDILDAQGLQGKYRALVEWAKEGRRMTPMMFGLGDWWAHLGTLTSVFGEFFNENIYNKINRMKEENLRGEYAQKEKLNDIANSIDGITNGYEEITQLIFMGSETRVLTADEQGLTLSVKAGRRKFTTDELMRVYALSKNPIQRAKLERQGFTDEVMADIEEFLDPRLTEFVDKTVEYLSNEYYEGINDVYVKVNDVNLGYMENYFPTRTQFQGDLATQSRDQLLSSTYSGPNSQMADALKERVDTGSDILMNEGLGFHGELGNHINTMERFKAYSVGVQEINAILSDSFTVSLSELLGLGKALNDGVSAAVMPDVFRSDLQFKYIDTLMSKMVGAALSFKPMQVVKQMTSAIAGVKEYQYGKEKNLPVDILMFSMDFVRLLPKLILEGVSLGKYKGPVSTMIEDSATLRRRIEDNFGGDLYGLTSGVSGRTRRVTARDYTLAAKALKGLSRFGGTATSSGDIAGVMGYLPAYMRDIQNGMSKEEAIEKFNQYNKTQQSRREAERAPIQTYQNGVSRLFTAFTSSQLLYLNEIVTTSNNMLKSIRKGEKIKASDSRGFALALVGYSVMFTLATNMWKLMFGDDEEKEKAWLDVGLSPVKNYFVIPVLGSYINDGYNWIVENNYPSQVAKDPLQSTIRDVKKAYKKEDYIRIGSEITEIGLGTNFDMFRGMMDIANGQPMDESFYDVMGVPPSQRPED